MHTYRILSRIKRLLEHSTQQLEDAQLLLDLIREQDDLDELPYVRALLVDTQSSLDELHWRSLLSGPDSEPSAFLRIQALECNEEALDWAHMLVRMMVRLTQRLGLDAQLLKPPRNHGTVKALIHVKGPLAYGWLRPEAGVHEITRPTGTTLDAPLVTSQALITVLADSDHANRHVINDEDLVMGIYRSSGACCWYNKRCSTVMLTHTPSGISETVCSSSQHKARALALRLLRAQLTRGLDASHSALVRSVKMGPHARVADPLTGLTSTCVRELLDGQCEPFILARLAYPRTR